MAAPSYTTDLTIITTCDGADTLDEFDGYTQGGVPVAGDTDYFIQGIACHTADEKNKTGLQSIAYDSGAGITIPASHCIFMWQVMLAGNAISSFDTGGLRLIAGDDLSNFKAWNTGGVGFGRNPYGGWQNVAVDPTFTADDTGGSQTIWRWFGSGVNMTSAIFKGNLHGIDALRYGRGELIVTDGDASNGYATFAGMATENDAQSYKWGLFQDQAGGYLWKGLISLGTASSGIVDFRDSNRSIIADSTPRTYAAFNKIEVTYSGSNVEWTGINISALDPDQLSPGSFEMVGNPTVSMDACSFTDMTTFVFLSTATITDTTFRRCDQITQNSATIDGCVMDQPPVASGTAFVVSDDPSLISSSAFTSAGQGHAIEITDTGTYGLSADFFTGYGASGTLNAAIYNNSGGLVTLNITNFGDTPTYRNGASAFTVVNNAVDLDLKIIDDAQANIQDAWCAVYDSGAVQLMNEQSLADGTATESYNYLGEESAVVRVRKYGYKYYKSNQTITSAGLNLTITLVTDPQQT